MQDFEKTVKQQRGYFDSGITLDIDFRILQLKKLRNWVRNNQKRICGALRKDLNKTRKEALLTEVLMVYTEINDALKNVRKWSSPQWARTSLMQMPSKCRTYAEPYGSVLIMSPWNYPFMLTVAPLVGAIAAGNCVVLKPSAYAQHTSRLLGEMASEIFAPSYVTVVQGGRDEITGLLEQKFDYIFFTGSSNVGKVVMQAAAKNLTPMTLELGGKSPCIVDATADLDAAAKRIVWGKFLNAGQTCIAPDYLLVHRSVQQRLEALMRNYMMRFYGREAHRNDSFPKIINQKHYERLMGLLKDTEILFGGQGESDEQKIAPTLVLPKGGWEHPLMQEEIFGPILPIIPFDNIEEAASKIRKGPKPLALYLFSQSKAVQRYVLRNISFGGGCINDTILHIATTHMPFGGVGESGMGNYHGKASFNTFSHTKSVMHRGRIDFPIRYPPYSNR